MIGQVLELAMQDIPDWLLICDGSTYADVDYPELGAVIHDGYRVDADHFKVPMRLSRFALGGTFPATQGGEETHTLTVAEMPSHFHIDNSTDLTGVFVFPGEAPAVIGSLPGATESAGGGEAHNNMPPYEESQFYIVARFPTAG